MVVVLVVVVVIIRTFLPSTVLKFIYGLNNNAKLLYKCPQKVPGISSLHRLIQSSSLGQWCTFTNIHKEFGSIPGNHFSVLLSVLLSLLQ
jgi:hypothetical protein